MQPRDIDPGPCSHCGSELKWKATVGAEKTAQTHFYHCENCGHIHTVEQSVDYAAGHTIE